MKKSILTKNQVKTFTKCFVEDGQKYKIEANVRYDDKCGNGHNSFSITGTIYRVETNGIFSWDSCGCIHDEIKKHFPKLRKYIKWHLCSSEGPTHYVANTIYLAGDKDYHGKRKGEGLYSDNYIYFEGFPIGFKLDKKFCESIKSLHPQEIKNLTINKIVDEKDSKYYRFTLSCFNCNSWASCPFKTLQEAEEFLKAFKTFNFEIKKVYTTFSEGKERDFDAARATGIWEDATDEELSQDPEELKKVLEARLPALMDAFVADIEELGFVY